MSSIDASDTPAGAPGSTPEAAAGAPAEPRVALAASSPRPAASSRSARSPRGPRTPTGYERALGHEVAPARAPRAPREPDAARAQRLPRRAVHGVLLLDKPLGWTSNDALQKVKNALRAEKAGHTGTLDPLATGLLPLCFGGATKFSQVSLESDKAYRATLQLGQTRAGGDREGEVLLERPVDVDLARIQAACAALTGPIAQLPPMHSALKVGGKALYEYARAGETVERSPRQVTIHRLDIVQWQAEQPATLVVDVVCSKGTYIRTLAEDIGERLGCGAHLAALQRTACGPAQVAQAIGLEAFLALEDEARLALLRPADVLLADWPAVELDTVDAGRFLAGQRRRSPGPDAPVLRVYGPGGIDFLGAAHRVAGSLVADRLMAPPEIAAMRRGRGPVPERPPDTPAA